jgi:hypothetical protein
VLFLHQQPTRLRVAALVGIHGRDASQQVRSAAPVTLLHSGVQRCRLVAGWVRPAGRSPTRERRRIPASSSPRSAAANSWRPSEAALILADGAGDGREEASCTEGRRSGSTPSVGAHGQLSGGGTNSTDEATSKHAGLPARRTRSTAQGIAPAGANSSAQASTFVLVTGPNPPRSPNPTTGRDSHVLFFGCFACVETASTAMSRCPPPPPGLL